MTSAVPAIVSTGTVTALPAPTVSTNRASDLTHPARPPSTATSTRTGWPPPPWFQYGPSTGYGSATPATPAGADTRPVPVTAPVSLAPNTTYHYRALASNGAGSSVGPDSTFTTYGPPAATTGGASGLTATAWTLGGMVDANGLDATAWFEYGTTTDYGSHTVQDVAGNTGYNVAVNATVGGLAPNTTYHYRLVVRNSSGLAYGTDRTFTTFRTAGRDDRGAIGVTASSASLTGSVDPYGLATTYRAEWGPTTGYGWTSTWRSAGSATWGATVSVAITGLASRQLSHYRIVATNSAGTTYSADRTVSSP